MTDVTMPADALEAGAKVLADINGWRDEQGLIACMPVARLCFLAIVEAWEGAKTIRDDGRRQTYVLPALILPLPQETRDD